MHECAYSAFDEVKIAGCEYFSSDCLFALSEHSYPSHILMYLSNEHLYVYKQGVLLKELQLNMAGECNNGGFLLGLTKEEPDFKKILVVKSAKECCKENIGEISNLCVLN